MGHRIKFTLELSVKYQEEDEWKELPYKDQQRAGLLAETILNDYFESRGLAERVMDRYFSKYGSNLALRAIVAPQS